MKKLAAVFLTLFSISAFAALPSGVTPLISGIGADEAAAIAGLSASENALAAAAPFITDAVATGGVAAATSYVSPITALSLGVAAVTGVIIWHDYYSNKQIKVQVDPTLDISHPPGWTKNANGVYTAPATTPPLTTGGTAGGTGWDAWGRTYATPEAAAQALMNMRSCAYSGTTDCVVNGDQPYPNSGDNGVIDFYNYYGNAATRPDADARINKWLANGSPHQGGSWYSFSFVSIDQSDSIVNGQHVRYFTYQQTYADSWGFTRSDWYVASITVAPTTTATCSTGYSSDGAGNCVLTDPSAIVAAYSANMPNGPCNVYRNSSGQFYTLPGDVNCNPFSQYYQGTNYVGESDAGGSIAITANPDGSVDIQKSTPHPDTQTTQVQTVHAVPQSAAGSSPTVQNITNNYYPGVGATSDPVTQTLNSAKAGTPAASTPTAIPQVQTVNPTVSFPSKMDVSGSVVTIDSQGHSETDMPSAADKAAAYKDESGFFQPLVDRFHSLTTFQFQAHTSQCPSISFNFRIGWGSMNLGTFNHSMTEVCDTLENNRSLIQGLFALVYGFAAIMIFLSA